MNPVPRILVFHHNRLFRECLARVLSQDNCHTAQPADHGLEDCERMFAESRADVILVDLNLPENLAVRLTIEARKYDAKVIVLVPDDHEKLVECIATGAHGCVLERSTLNELTPALERVLRGEVFCSADIVQSMFAQLSKLAREAQWRTQLHAAKLTNREQEVLELLSERLSNKQIARRLSVSLYTVKNHVHNILEKLAVETRLDAVERARDRRRVDDP